MKEKSKEELLECIEKKEAEIHDLHNRIEALGKYEKYEESAKEIYVIKQSLVDAGFTDEQAFELIRSMTEASLRPRLF